MVMEVELIKLLAEMTFTEIKLQRLQVAQLLQSALLNFIFSKPHWEKQLSRTD